MKKRILPFLLAFLMVMSIFPAPVYATDSSDVTITPTETPTEAPAEPAAAIDDSDSSDSAYLANKGRKATINPNYVGYLYICADPSLEAGWSSVQPTSDPLFTVELTLVITDVYDNGTELWYKVGAAEGYTLPDSLSAKPWVFQNVIGDSPDYDSLILMEEEPVNPCACCDSCTGAEGCACACGACDFCAKEEEPTVPSISDTVIDSNGNEQTVTVSGDALPEGAKLNVQTADVSAQLNKFGVSASALVFGLDISVLLADDSQWQPAAGSSVKVKIPVDVTAGTTIGLLHTHEGVTSYIGMTEVLPDGTVEFYTDGFSEFAGFTVDFHYNGTDYSIGGLTSITLSELFVELGIDRNAAHAIEVVFSDNTLIKVTQTDGDWLLESLQAFDTEETLKITFGDGEIIVIDVTDVMYYEGVNGQTYNVPYWNIDSEGVLRIAINYDNVPMTIYLYKESVFSVSWDIVTGGSYIDTSGTRTLTVQINNNIPIESNAVDIDLNPGGRVHLDVYRYIDITYDNGGKAAANMPGNVVDRKITTSTNNYTISSTVPTVQGYTFSHWSGSDGKTYKAGETASLTSNTTLTANWTANPYAYTVVYRSTSGASLGSTTVTYNYGTTNTITPPAIAGYTTPASQSVAWDSTSKTITFTYTPITYTISYTLNGGTVSTANPTSYNIETATFTLNNPTRTGYTFAGWTGTGLSSASTSVSIAKGSTGNRTYTANWTPITYSVSFNGNGSTGGSMSNQSFTYDTAQDLTANAYKREYTVTYDTNGGNTITAATAAATFNGWEDHGSIVYKGTTYAYTYFDAPYYANTYSDLMKAFGYNKYNLLNHWVTYTLNGSETRVAVGSSPGLYPNTANVNNLSTTAGYVVPLYANWTLGSVTLPTPTRANHTFKGWSDGTTTYAAGASYTPTADVTLTALWEENTKYSVTYRYSGTVPAGAPAVPAETKEYTGNAVTVKEAPTLTGYIFSGWGTQDVTVTNGSFTMPAFDVAFTGSWTPISYTVAFNGNNATDGSVGSISATYGQNVTLPTNGFRRVVTVKFNVNGGNALANSEVKLEAGFKGWKMDNTGEAVQPGTQVSNLIATDGATVTYYADWELQSVTMPDCSRTGYTFAGWKLENSNTVYQTGASVQPKQDITLVAQWNPVNYTITYDTDGGETISPVNYDIEDQVTLVTPTRNGYDFLSWEVTTNDGNWTAGSYDGGQQLSRMHGNVTLKARWKRQTGDLKLTVSGGPAIVTVSGEGLNITVVLENGSKTIAGLPTGTYTVTVEGASAATTATVDNSRPVVNKDETAEVRITVGSKNTNWFTGFHRVTNQCTG